MRRQSFSAPARLCVDRLDTAVKHLGHRILSLSSLVSGSADTSSLPSACSLLTDRMSRTCHGCHAPLDHHHHKDHPSGWLKCPLDHWAGCEGGIVEGKAQNGSDWRGCPPDYVYVESVSDEDEDLGDDLEKNDITIDAGDEPGHVKEKVVDTNLESVEVVTDNNGSGLEVGDGDDIIRQLEEANKLLKQQVATRAKEEEAARARRIAMLKAENLRLAQAMGGDIGGARIKTVSGSHPPPHPKNKQPVLVTDKAAHKPVQEHMSRRSLRAQEYRPEDDSVYTGLNIKGIRKIPGLQPQVERLVSQIQERAPSLDRRPSFIPARETPPGFALIPSVTVSGSNQNDLETSSDEDCDEQPQPGYVFKWMRDEHGEKYFTEVKQVAEEQQEMVYRYVKDSATGRSYKRLVLKNDPDRELVPQWVIDPGTGRKVKMLVPNQLSSTKLKKGKQSSSQSVTLASSPGDSYTTPLHPSAQRRISQHSSSSIPPRNLGALQEEKQGKMPSIVQFARICPVSWTSKVTSDKLNMGLWCWSFIVELLATRTGQADPLPSGELEARMQHFLNVLEIALQPSAPTDFENHGWKVARLYAEKVQHKVERGDTWLGFERRYGTDSQPHELMEAEKELAMKVPKVPKQPKDEDVKKDAKKTCTTWNSSSVEGKCEFEVQYDGRSCSRRHECSWCKEKGKRSLGHQRSFCRQRLAAGEQ